jgi:hypothetical protein
LGRTRGESGRVFRFELLQHGLDVFAGTQTVDAKIDAGAGKVSLGDVPHLHVVGKAAGRMDPEVAENQVFSRPVFNAGGFFPGSLTATLDFILVSGPPIMGGRKLARVRGHPWKELQAGELRGQGRFL